MGRDIATSRPWGDKPEPGSHIMAVQAVGGRFDGFILAQPVHSNDVGVLNFPAYLAIDINDGKDGKELYELCIEELEMRENVPSRWVGYRPIEFADMSGEQNVMHFSGTKDGQLVLTTDGTIKEI